MNRSLILLVALVFSVINASDSGHDKVRYENRFSTKIIKKKNNYLKRYGVTRRRKPTEDRYEKFRKFYIKIDLISKKCKKLYEEIDDIINKILSASSTITCVSPRLNLKNQLPYKLFSMRNHGNINKNLIKIDEFLNNQLDTLNNINVKISKIIAVIDGKISDLAVNLSCIETIGKPIFLDKKYWAGEHKERDSSIGNTINIHGACKAINYCVQFFEKRQKFLENCFNMISNDQIKMIDVNQKEAEKITEINQQ